MAAAGALDLNVLVDASDWVAALPGVEGHCRRAAEAAFHRIWRSGAKRRKSLEQPRGTRKQITGR